MIDYRNILPYGDTLGDAKTQISFSLPVPCGQKGIEAAKILAGKMGLREPLVAYQGELDEDYSFYVVYGSVTHFVDYESISVYDAVDKVMDMGEIDEFIRSNFGRKLTVVGASTGTDAHTVGIDAIINMKGIAGHYGLERYEMLDAYNLGSQVSNELLVRKAVELNADVLLVSQTVTQKNVHIANLSNLVDILEAEGLREKFVLICGGSRINHELAKELGYDAGFGAGKYAEDVATFFVEELLRRNNS